MNAPTRARRLLSAQPADVDLGPAFDEALERLADLAHRLGQVRAVHRPYRRLRWTRSRCNGCGQPYPCATLRAANPA
ncbi:MAG: hypothetical protein JWM02_286 [Frankiales bacterium]|nr:hypothetical protein [Frankiales bacterium]